MPKRIKDVKDILDRYFDIAIMWAVNRDMGNNDDISNYISIIINFSSELDNENNLESLLYMQYDRFKDVNSDYTLFEEKLDNNKLAEIFKYAVKSKNKEISLAIFVNILSIWAIYETDYNLDNLINNLIRILVMLFPKN